MKSEADQIVQRLTAASQYYYNGDGGENIPDAEYDALRDRLVAIDPEHEFLSLVGAPVTREKRAHKVAMYSLDKATSDKELAVFCARVLEAGGQPVFVVQPKLDGSSLELIYVGGKLESAITRGDGEIGEDVTANVKRILGVPHSLTERINCSVRGECLLSVANWPLLDPEKKTNPRNQGNGTIRRSDGSGCDKLTFTPFDITVEGTKFAYEADKTERLEALGFLDPAETTVTTREGLSWIIATWEAKRPNYGFHIDGVVVKANSCFIQEKLGVSSGCPRGQIAFKWASDIAVTKLAGVELTVGHTGQIIPTAILDPVQLMGTTVSRALLNNWNEIARIGVKIGDMVKVTKRGDIIPKVEGVAIPRVDGEVIAEPTQCPVCKGKAGRKGDSAQTFCLSDNCAAKAQGKVKRWVTSLNILGIGDELLDYLCQPGSGTPRVALVQDPADLYLLTDRILETCQVGNGRLGLKRAAAIVKEIDKTREMGVDQFIGSLGLPFLGKRRVQIIREASAGFLEHVDSWFDGTLLTPGMAEQVGIPGTIDEIAEALAQAEPLARRLLKHITIKSQIKVAAGTVEVEQKPKAANQMSFCLTGTMSRGRKEIAADIEAAGHIVKDDVAAGLGYLVQADPSSKSSKSKKADKHGVKIISEEELLKLIGK